MGPKKQIKTFLRLILLVAIPVLAMLCLNGHKAYAMVPNDGNIPYGNIPGEVEYNAEQACDITGNGIANPNWLSPTYEEAKESGATIPNGSDPNANDSSYDATSVFIEAGHDTTLFWNAADMYCNTGPQHYVYSDGDIWTGFIGTSNNPLYTTQTTEHTTVDLYQLTSDPNITFGESSPIQGINYQNPPWACAPSANPNPNPGCDWKGNILEVNPDNGSGGSNSTWFSNIDSVEFTVPAQSKGGQITLYFDTIGISQFTTGPFLCVGMPWTGDHYDLYNFDGQYSPIGDPSVSSCLVNKQKFVIDIDYTVNISGTIYTYSPSDGKETLGGVQVVLKDTSNGKSYPATYNDSLNNGTGTDGTYNIIGVPLDDGFTLSMNEGADSNNYYISPSGGDMYSGTCTGTPEPTDPPWCTTPSYNDYIDQVAGEPQILIKGHPEPYYNRGADNGYDFVYPLFAITGAKVDTNGSNLPTDFGATVGVLGTTDNTINNTFSFDDLPWITGNYTVQAAANYTDSSGTTWNLVGSAWCGTAGCIPFADHYESYPIKSSGTDSVSFAIPNSDDEVNIHFIYQPKSTPTSSTATITGTKVDTSDKSLSSNFGSNVDVNDNNGNVEDLQTNPFTFSNLAIPSSKQYIVTPDPTWSYGGNNYTLVGTNWCNTAGCGITLGLSGGNWTSSSSVTVTVNALDDPVVMKIEYNKSTSSSTAMITGTKVDTGDHLLSNFNSNVDVNYGTGEKDLQTNPFTFANLVMTSNRKYIVTPDPAWSFGGNNYALEGINWCNTAGCNTGFGPTGSNWTPYSSGVPSVTVTVNGADDPVVMKIEYLKGTTSSNGMIMGTLVDTNNKPLSKDFDAHAWIPGISADSSTSNTFTFTDEIDPGNTYMLDANASYTYKGNSYSLVGAVYCNTAGCTPSLTDNYESSSTFGNSFQIAVPKNNNPAIVHLIYNEDHPEIKAYKVDTANKVFASDFAAEVHVGGILPPDNTTTNPAIFTDGLSTSHSYNVAAIHSYTYKGNTYTLVGASWCYTAGCDPAFDATDNYQQLITTTTITVFVPATGDPVVIHFEYKGNTVPTSNNCPLVPGFDTNVTVNLAYTGFNNPALTPAQQVTSQPATDTTAPSPVEEDDPVEVYYHSPGGGLPDGSITDISTGLTDQTASHNPQYKTQVTTVSKSGVSSSSVTLDYSPYITYYPYDTSEPQINYYSVCNKIIWTANFAGYSCSDDSIMSGLGSSTVCVTTTSATASGYTCAHTAGGGDLYGDLCYTGDGTRNKKTGACETNYHPAPLTCYNNDHGANTTYTCNGVDNGISDTCTSSTPAPANYIYIAGPPAQEYSDPVATVDGPQMPECYDRTFQLVPNAGSIKFNDYEDPSSIEYDGSVTSNYATDLAAGLDPVQLRIPSSVNNINLTLNVTVQQLDGDTVVNSYPLPDFTNTTTSGGNFDYLSGAMPSINGNFVGSSNNLTEVDQATFTTVYPAVGDVQTPWIPSEFQYGDEVCATLSADPSGTEMDVTGAEAPPTTGPTTSPQTCSNPLAAEPYIKVFGGDVSAGTATNITGQSCTNEAGIDTFNLGDNNSYAGSGTQLAAFAITAIDGFASAQNDNGTGISPPPTATALTFANKTSGEYGGNFVGSANDCSTDYYAKYAALADQSLYGTPDAGLALQEALSTGGNVAYSVSGGTIGDPSTPINIPTGDNIVIYSDGPITIAGNITYGGVSTDLSQMPNLEIITDNTGIYINSAVTQLDGEYVAEGTGGIINDCADVADTDDWFPSTDGSPSCGQELTVDGSFTANALYLSRTNGSLHEASTSDGPGANNAAEEFDYSPSNWLTYPNQTTVPDVQAVSSLPPVL